mmetsp:Transcript_23700/g.68127  ORF Transcript_23700/g.68127 Transcript_23700/m.68127 type:complete len:531 (+) Transcript_23700:58-1650(+)|eukprot:CAMPEP_0176028172 /NCGR_PEP_ID=MMETSP0120_2-20121206/13824_1 /TAXON_ID=160619 /ORGANISM="Kryptoperidinium foliaceum, Strain CCMP 1326" /LENGTH=530 /DNA_ID=CAMNT_0017361381 /DNA_START=47 /DNA_END=1639 /DNA_ORIENTATION=+
MASASSIDDGRQGAQQPGLRSALKRRAEPSAPAAATVNTEVCRRTSSGTSSGSEPPALRGILVHGQKPEAGKVEKPIRHRVAFGFRYSCELDTLQESSGKRVSDVEDEKRLRRWREWQEECRELLGDDFVDGDSGHESNHSGGGSGEETDDASSDCFDNDVGCRRRSRSRSECDLAASAESSDEERSHAGDVGSDRDSDPAWPEAAAPERRARCRARTKTAGEEELAAQIGAAGDSADIQAAGEPEAAAEEREAPVAERRPRRRARTQTAVGEDLEAILGAAAGEGGSGGSDVGAPEPKPPARLRRRARSHAMACEELHASLAPASESDDGLAATVAQAVAAYVPPPWVPPPRRTAWQAPRRLQRASISGEIERLLGGGPPKEESEAKSAIDEANAVSNRIATATSRRAHLGARASQSRRTPSEDEPRAADDGCVAEGDSSSAEEPLAETMARLRDMAQSLQESLDDQHTQELRPDDDMACNEDRGPGSVQWVAFDDFLRKYGDVEGSARWSAAAAERRSSQATRHSAVR